MAKNKQTGNLSINSENIFPIIKKWLYSDQDIFYRELISNCCDAITKLKKLEMMGECELSNDYKAKVLVSLDPKAKTITITDNGLGMDADEINEYINQIAFSGATDFLNKYKDKANEDQIIGHFGLGFYSVFMVADKVHIDSLSYKEGAVAVHWECDGGSEFSMEEGSLEGVGTKITIFLNEDCLEYCNEYKAREVIGKYCSFMPYEIYVDVVGKAEPEKKDADGEDSKPEEPTPINDTTPLWAKNPSEVSDEDYKSFYHKVFMDYKEPLFWIHLNMDYPFNLKGILYFPKINLEFESIEGTIKLYNNQVFVADNIKEVIPEFLMLLKGCIDCPDLPLNVSRSALQNDGFVTKISDYITKKIADKLSGMCKTDRENYEKYWDDISPFIKYGMLRDEKFCDKMSDFVLFKDLEDSYTTLPDLLKPVEKPEKEETKDSDKDSDKEESEEENKQTTVYYVSDVNAQGQYIKLFKDQGMKAIILDKAVDTSFITQLERRHPDYTFARIDAQMGDDLMEQGAEVSEDDTNTLTELFKKALGKEEIKLSLVKLKDDSISSMITLSETNRRMQEMMKLYSMPGTDMAGMESMFGRDETLVLNLGNELVQYIINHKDGENTEDFCKHLYDLALIANSPLDPKRMEEFIARSNKIMMKLAK